MSDLLDNQEFDPDNTKHIFKVLEEVQAERPSLSKLRILQIMEFCSIKPVPPRTIQEFRDEVLELTKLV